MKLLTLTEFLQTTPLATLFEGSNIDTATQEAVERQYQFRYVCDNDKFLAFFNRSARVFSKQYTDYLRVELTKIDPMVADYMERQITRDDTRSIDSNEKTAADNTSKSVSNDTGSRVSNSESSSDGTVETSTSNVSKDSGTDTQTDETKGTSQSSDHTVGTVTGTTDVTSDTKVLNGSTPDSSLFPADGGFPDALAWQYASAQAETEATSKQTDSQNTDTTVSSTGSTTGDTTSTTQYGKTVTDTGSADTTTKTTGTGKDTVTDSRDGTITNTGNLTGTTDAKVNEAFAGDMKERYSGRHESPQDLLARARNYIETTNAFLWLLSKLDTCFFSFYELED